MGADVKSRVDEGLADDQQREQDDRAALLHDHECPENNGDVQNGNTAIGGQHQGRHGCAAELALADVIHEKREQVAGENAGSGPPGSPGQGVPHEVGQGFPAEIE